MHIIEKDEHLDYEAFNAVGLPEKGYTEALGRRTWNLYHGVADHYGCEACRGGAQTLISGIHDMVNLHLGKPIHDIERWKEFNKLVDETRKKNPHTKHYRHERVESPDHFDPQSFRTVTEGKHRIVIGCPVGHFTAGRCEPGTETQAILHPVGERHH